MHVFRFPFKYYCITSNSNMYLSELFFLFFNGIRNLPDLDSEDVIVALLTDIDNVGVVAVVVVLVDGPPVSISSKPCSMFS